MFVEIASWISWNHNNASITMRAITMGWRAVAVFICVVGATARTPADDAYDRANRLFVEKKFSACMTALDEALKLDPKLVPALTLRAKVAMTQNRFDVARTSLEAALAVDPLSPYARFLYGMQFYLANDMPDARAELEKARKLDRPDPRASLYLGLTLESLGKTDEAMSFYEEAVQREGKAGRAEADTLLTGARLLLLLGRNAECERWIGQSLSLAPRSRDGHYELARLSLREADARRAAAEGETALRLSGGVTSDAQIHYLLIRAYRESGRKAEAEHEAQILRAAEQSVSEQSGSAARAKGIESRQ